MSNNNKKMTDKEFIEWAKKRMIVWLDENQLKGNKDFKAFRWNHLWRLIELAEKKT